jgi:DegV family protein with EDD domain
MEAEVKFKIVADSAADMTEMSGDVPFSFVPLHIIVDGRDYTDNEELDTEILQEALVMGKSSSSACPSPEDWLSAFDDAENVYCVTITSGLSGSYNSACSAKKIYETENEGKRVFVLDTLSAGPEITLVIEKLEECIDDGMSYEDICNFITGYLKKTGLIFMLKSLKTFANNGRVSPLVAKLVGIAGICIVGKASDEGTLEPMHKCRGEARSLQTLVTELGVQGFRSGKISIGHCQNEAAARQLKALILQTYKNVQVEIHPFRGLCSFYAEKGGVLVGFEKA